MCDTLVALGNSTKDGNVVFGKNSDRPQSEAQLVTYLPRTQHSKGEEVKCTYISIPQVSETHETILSQPYWMFGAEMATNSYGVVIGNEAVYSRENYQDSGLLGMDLLRLGVERGQSAKEALNVITDLLEKFGQGGGCAYGQQGWTYHNFFLVADTKEAYVLETADKWWIVEIVKDVRSISNNLSIRGKGDMRRNGIIQHAIEKGYCKDDNDFDFAMIFSDPQIPNKFSPYTREGCSLAMLNENNQKITPALMMEFLREHNVGICMHGSFQSTGSQVSHLKKDGKSIHWFTGGTLPCVNIFKPYVFPGQGQIFSTEKPGPYKELDSSWFWSRHKEFISPYKKHSIKPEKQEYINRLKKIEKRLLSDVENVTNQETSLSSNDFTKKVITLNNKAWELAEELIK